MKLLVELKRLAEQLRRQGLRLSLLKHRGGAPRSNAPGSKSIWARCDRMQQR